MFATDKIGDDDDGRDGTAGRQGVVRRRRRPICRSIARGRAAPTGSTTISCGFYRDDASATGWNNLVFPNVGDAARAVAATRGINRLVATEFEDHEKAHGRGHRRQGPRMLEPGHERQVRRRDGRGRHARHALAGRVPGDGRRPRQLSSTTWPSPRKNKRISLGLIVLLYLGVLFVFAYWLKREYWKDIH